MCKKLIFLTSFVLLLGLATSLASANPLGQDPGPDGIVSVEAEHYDDNVEQSGAKWEEVGPTGGFTGTAGMQVLGPSFYDPGYAATSPRLDYEINFVKTGTHYVWILAWADGGGDDSCHVGLDGEERPLSSNWTGGGNNWSNGRYPETGRAQFEVTTPGLHVLNIWVREDGLIVDKIVLTTNPDYTPTGEGPEESSRGPRLKAYGPAPDDGELYLDTWVSLSWSAGDTAISHDIYFGENFDDVNDGTGDTFRGNQAGIFYIVGFPGYTYPDGLIPGTTYYWRIDEVEADGTTKHKGYVWSFTIPPRNAYVPTPADGAVFIDPNVEFSWEPGFGVKLHYVYFGDNFDDVNNAVVGLPQATTTYTPGTLEFDKVYYWRIDEFDAITTHKGDVWSFKTLPVIPITDPNLVGWWKFEAGAGTMVLDFSGHGNHGTIVDNVQWVPGQFNLALEFLGDGQGHVELPAGMVTTAQGSVAMWVNTDLIDDEGMFWYGTETSGDGFGDENEIHIHIDDPGVLGFGLEGATDVRLDGPQIAGAGWTHVAVTWDLTDGCRLYANGVQVDFAAHNNTVVDLAVIRLGRPVDTGNGNRYHDGLMDDVRLFDYAISAAQVVEAMRGDPLLAWSPNPTNGSTLYIRDATPLSWSPGDNASQHDVYFGTDRGAVADADASDTTGIYRGRQGVTIYTPPDVEWGGGPYYWRIDEYNTEATISKGNVWSFTVADFIVIDDFEDYDVGNNEIWWAWIDGLGYASHPTKPSHPGNGTGSMVGDETTGSYMEETIVHGGGKSMPLFYDNNQQGKLRYSEVEKTLSSRRDWTKEGVGVLTIWFRGDAANAAETLYVALDGNAIVTNDNPAAAQVETWTEWTIDLSAPGGFADQGVNLANVNTIAIGLGNKKNPAAGGSGTL